jgi:hypothetical protein
MHGAEALVTAAAASYAASCALGVRALRSPDGTTGVRWAHHALYASTAALTAASLTSLARRPTRAARALLPAAAPLAVIPFAGTHGRRHVLAALSAAPAFATAVVRAWR